MRFLKIGFVLSMIFLLQTGTKMEGVINPINHMKLVQSQSVSKGENQPESQSGGKWGSRSESQSGCRWESQSESQSRRKCEDQSESQSVSNWEKQSESQLECLSESQSDSESESQSELQTETETETETDSESEPQTESETETQTETETETELPREVIVENIRTVYPGDSREYDDTNDVELKADVRGLPAEMQVLISGKSEYRRVGIWKVDVSCELTGKDAENYRLKVEKSNIKVHIIPRVLNIRIAPGRKPYFSDNSMQLLEFDERKDEIVKVSGFMKNGRPVKEYPKGFQKPEITIDERVLKQDSPMYEQGSLKKYARALVVKRDKKGNITGNTTDNYCYNLLRDSQLYHPGSITLVKTKVSETDDYQVIPESQEGYLRNNHGKIIVKKGMRLKIVPHKKSGYNQTIISKELMEDGTFFFVLENRDEAGTLLAQSEKQTVAYEVDDLPPAGLGILANEKILSGGMNETTFYHNSVLVKFTGYSDSQAGIRSVMYWIREIQDGDVQPISAIKAGYENQKNLWRSGTSTEVKKEGAYQVFARVEDQVGNAAYFGGNTIVIDKTTPRITVEGVTDQSANNGSLKLRILCEDNYYWKDSLEATLIGDRNGEKKLKYERKKTDKGEQLIFEAIPEKKEWDDYYVLYLSAGDQAGNIATHEIFFSVNRFGSVYGLGKETRKQIDHYYSNKAFDVEIREINLHSLQEAQLTVTRDGELRILSQDRDYSVTKIEGKNGYKEYRYLIPARCFEDEGAYAVSLNSKDEAGNEGDHKLQKKYIEFVIDKTPPSIMIAGLDDKSFYPEKDRSVVVDSRDNTKLKEQMVYLDGALIKSSTNQETSFTILQKDQWREMEVWAVDQAGNEAKRKITFCISKSEKGILAIPMSPEYLKEKNYFTKRDRDQVDKETFTIPEVINGERQIGEDRNRETEANQFVENEEKRADKKGGAGYIPFGIKALMVMTGACIGVFSYRRWGRRRSKE